MSTSTFCDFVEECTFYYTNEESELNSSKVYIESRLGAARLPLNVAVPLTILNAIIFVTGMVGNFCVCIVIIRHASLHTATNYYLFNLALSDMTLLIFGLPNDVAIYWQQYPWRLGRIFCRTRAFVSEAATYASVLTVVAFSTERYLAICQPICFRKVSGLSRALKIIAVLWMLSCVCAIPVYISTDVHYLRFPQNSNIILQASAFCATLELPEAIPLAELSTIMFFLLPMLVICIEYVKMGLEIADQSTLIGKRIKGSVHRGRRIRSNRMIFKMLVAVVVCFFMCWMPFHIQRLLFIYGRDLPHYKELNSWVFYITGMFYYFSPTLNPILYNAMSKKYRKAFRETLFGAKRAQRPSAQYSSTGGLRREPCTKLATEGRESKKQLLPQK